MAGRIKDREASRGLFCLWIGGGERSEPSPECLSGHVIQKANPVTLTSYGQAPLGLEGSGASRRPGSIVPVLRTERWVRPTERAGSEGSFICRCLGQRKPDNRASLRGPPIGGQDRDGVSNRRSALYTLCLFEAFPSRGNEGSEKKNSESYTSRTISAFPPFGGWRHHLSPASGGTMDA